MFWVYYTIEIFVLCAFLAGIMIPEILSISYRRNLYDEPDERKIHTCIVPRLGGIAFVPVILFSLSLALGLASDFADNSLIDQMHLNLRSVTFAFCPLTLLYVVGIADDLIGVKYSAKFVVQIISAILLALGGFGISKFHGFLGLDTVHPVVMWITTIGLSVFIVNAINLIDGIDGLASGLSAVAFVAYGVAFLRVGEYFYAWIAAAALGVIVPFFIHNVFGDPNKQHKIFMGDTGSLTIGMLLCILSFKIMTMDSMPDNLNPLIVAMSPLVIPCFDVVRVFIGRIRNHKSPFLPDKTHIHHKLLSLGMSQWMAMLFIICASMLFTAFNAAVSMWFNVNIIILFDIVAFSLIYTVAKLIWHKK